MDLSGLYCVFLLSLRLMVIFFLTPLLSISPIPTIVKIMLSLGLSYMIVTLLALHAPLPATSWYLLWQVFNELIIAAVMAFGVHSAFGALAFSGRLIDTQMGLGLAGMVDPLTKTSSSIIALVFKLLAIAYLYSINGHFTLFDYFIHSLDKLPLGAVLSPELLFHVVMQFAAIFLLAISLAAPIMIGLFILDITIAVIARSMPQFNAFIMGLPAKIGLGIVLLTVLIPYLGSFFALWFRSLLIYWDNL